MNSSKIWVNKACQAAAWWAHCFEHKWMTTNSILLSHVPVRHFVTHYTLNNTLVRAAAHRYLRCLVETFARRVWSSKLCRHWECGDQLWKSSQASATLADPTHKQRETSAPFGLHPLKSDKKSHENIHVAYSYMVYYLDLVVAFGEGQVNDQAKLLVVFVQSVQQLPGTKDLRMWKQAVERLKE